MEVLFSQITPSADAPEAAQLAFVPSVVKYLPALPVWLGRALIVLHVGADVPFDVKTWPDVPFEMNDVVPEAD